MNVCRSQFRRVIELDRRIRAHQYPNCSSFAAEWEVSSKTIQRDIEFLKEHGAPLEYDASRQGYHYSSPSWMLPMLDLNEGELLHLLLAQEMASLFKGTPIAPALDGLFDKICLTLNEKVTVDPVLVREQFSFHGLPAREIDERVWEGLLKGLRGDRVTVVGYRHPTEADARERILEPLHLACIGGDWYLLAYEREKEGVRNFAVSRITTVTVRQEVFEPKEFIPEVYFANRFGRYVGKPGEGHVVKVRFSADAVPWVLERQYHREQKVQKHRDGRMTISFPMPSLYEAKRWVLQWGEAAEVLAPEALIQDIKSTAAAITKLYL